MSRYRIRHHSGFEYTAPVVTSVHHLHLEPRVILGQETEYFKVLIAPEDPSLVTTVDTWGNPYVVTQQAQTFRELSFTSLTQVSVFRKAPDPAVGSMPWEDVVMAANGNFDPQVQEYRWNSAHCHRDPALRSLTDGVFTDGADALAALAAFTDKIFKEFTYDPAATDIATPVAEVVANKRGVCQDFAHVGIAALRSLGFPARYISGYLETVPPEGQTRLQGADASHAWLAVWLPNLGWVDVDPTNGCIVADRHIATCVGRDFADVSPVTGVILGGGNQTQSVEVDVIPESEWGVNTPWWPLDTLPGDPAQSQIQSQSQSQG